MKTIFVALVLMLTSLFAVAADDRCMDGAKMVYSIAGLRDAGFSFEAVEEALRSNDLAADLEPWTADQAVQMARIVFAHSELNKKTLATDFYVHCMREPRRTRI